MRRERKLVPPKRRMRLFVVASGLAALLCLSAAITGQQNWTPAQKGNYGKVTRDALDRLLAAADKLQAGDRQGAKSLLQGMQSEVSLLTQVTDYFREQANREYGRCVTHIADLNTRVADLSNQEDALNVKIQDIEAQLVNIETRKQLTEEEIKKLRTSLSATEQLLAERRRKLHELEKWWWVPFYGAYLAIRTTVDNDIGNYNSLRNTLIDSSRRLSVNMQELQTITSMKATLDREKAVVSKTHSDLRLMRIGAEADLGNLNDDAVFLTEADAFWDRVGLLLRLDVGQALTAATDISNLQSQLTRENSPPLFNNPKQRPVVELYESLVAFADTIDQGNNFLTAQGSDFCGGPPRQKTGPDISSACKIDQFSSSYEIIDPKTCTFRYINPPGCPPRPKTVAVTEQALAAARGRGVWARASDQNWIGRARCSSPLVKYYGKLNGPEDCEKACMSDATCAVWTYNVRNGYMPGSFQECWGGTAAFSPNKADWGGFESGGLSVK